MSYSINSSNLTYQLFKFEIVDFNDPFMLSTLWYGDVVNYVTNAILSNQSSNGILSWSLLIPNISNAFILYSKFVNSTQIIIYQGKDDTLNGNLYSIYISTITIDGSGVVQSSQVSYVSRSSNITYDFNKMLTVSYLSVFYSFSYESTTVTENGSQINPWYFRIHRLNGYLCDDYWTWNNTDVSSTVQATQVILNSSTLSLVQAVSTSLPGVVDVTLDSDFVKFSNITTCLFGQSSRFSLDIWQYNDPNESSYETYFDPQLSTGTYNITTGTSNTTISLINYWMSSQFSINLSVNGNTTFPSWIYVDELNWGIKIIGGNITNIGTYSITFNISSLLLVLDTIYSSSITISILNQTPQISSSNGSNSTIVGRMLQYTINLTYNESDQIYWNLTLPNSNLSLNSSFTNNSFIIQWTPLINETGTYNFILNYYDTYHQSSPSNYTFQIIVNLSDPPYFNKDLTDIQVEAWIASIYTFPSADETRIANFTPPFSIYVTQESDVPLPSWITYNSFNLTFKAMIDQIGVTNQTLDVSFSESASDLSTSYSFKFSVIDDIVVNFQIIPDFNVIYQYSLAQDMSSYWPSDSSIEISLNYSSYYDKICIIYLIQP